MNWKIIFGGSFLIVIAFTSFIGYQFIQNRNNTLNIPQPSPLTQFSRNPRSYEESEKAKRIEGETYKKLIRGKVISYNPTEKRFSVAAEQKNDLGMAVIGVVDIVIDEDTMPEYLCWPEKFLVSKDTSIDIAKSFIPMGEDNYLYIRGETKKDLSTINSDLVSGKYVFSVLATPLESIESLIETGASIEAQYLDQLAILGCNE